MITFDVPYVGSKEPTVEDIWAVVPLSRPEMLSRVRANLERQRLKPKVCIVENGKALGACKQAGFQPEALLSCEPHQSVARNTALEHLQRVAPDAYWVAIDDDDYYSSEYVAEHAGLAQRGQVVGKGTHWVLFEQQCLALFRPWQSSGSARWLNGATLGAFVRESPAFVEKPTGEDGIFVSTFVARGGKAWHSSPYHTAYCRRGLDDHTFRAETREFVRVMGGTCLVLPQDRLDLVGAEMPIIGGKVLKWTDFPS